MYACIDAHTLQYLLLIQVITRTQTFYLHLLIATYCAN